MYALPRISSSMLFGLAVTLSLFYLMKVLIAADFVVPTPIKSITINFVKPIEMEELITEPRRIVPPEPEVIPPQPKPSFEQTGVETLTVKLPPPVGELVSKGPALTDGSHLPLVRIQPTYPQRAQYRGIEGYTIVEFDISPQGFVENPRVIEAHPSSVFNRTSLSAITKFKFKPKVVDGNPVRVFNAQNRFRFELASG